MKTNQLLVASTLLAATAPTLSAKKVERPSQPNIVFFLTEDLSPQFLALYNDGKGAPTPNVAALAREGILFTNAYSNAPVSSAARTTLISGCYAPKFGGSYHRNHQPWALPDGLFMFPHYLREAGYFTANASKTDYNCVLDTTAWNIMTGEVGDWRKRPNKEQPFFFQRNNMLTHESQFLYDQETIDTKKTNFSPDEVNIQSYHPNTPTMRYTYASFYDRITQSDKELGEIVEMLREDGVLDNTFIFYFGDNGGVMPGSKGYTNDIGIHVPMMVYIPTQWREYLDIPLNQYHDGFVSFMDLAPTVLELAGADIPKLMDGEPLLERGKELGRESVVCYGDRFDELYAMNRVLRKGNYSYARNFHPYQTRSLYALYRYKMVAFREWKEMFEGSELNEFQSRFFAPQGAEELFDLSVDPEGRHNLAQLPEYQKVLEDMREELQDYVIDKRDIALFPETILQEEALSNPYRFGKENRKRIEYFYEIANLELLPLVKAEKKLNKALASKDEVAQWWALDVCATFGTAATAQKEAAQAIYRNASRSYVKSRAMLFLTQQGESYQPEAMIELLKASKTGAEALLVLNDLAILVETGRMAPFKLDDSMILVEKCFGIDWRMEYLNSKCK